MKKLLVVLMLCAPAPSFAQTANPAPATPVVKPDEQRAVRLLLSAIHELPPRAQFEKAAANPFAVLTTIAGEQGPIAERAVEAMFMWPNDQTFGIAASQLGNPATKTGRKHRLLMLVAQTYGERAVELVAPYLRHNDMQLRITAAAAISKIKCDEASEALEAAIAAEKSEVVANEMRRYRMVVP